MSLPVAWRLRALIEFAVSEGWHVKRTGWTPQIHQDRLRHLHQLDRERLPGRPQRPCADSPSEREARPGPPTPRDAAMAEMTSQDMAGKLLAAGFERGGPSATALSDPIADTRWS